MSNPDELRKRLGEDLSQAMADARPTAEEVAKRPKRGPRLQGITRPELAGRLGVGLDAVGDWIRGDTEPSRENRLKLCDFLEITEDVFIARYHLGSVGHISRASPPVEAGRIEELAAEVAETRQMVKRLLDLLEERGETA